MIPEVAEFRLVEKKLESMERRIAVQEENHKETLKNLEWSHSTQLESMKQQMKCCLKAKQIELNSYRVQVAEVLETAQLVQKSLMC